MADDDNRTRTMRFTFPDGEEQEHAVPVPLPRVVELVQRRDYDFAQDGAEPPMPPAVRFRLVRFRLVHFADSTGRNWAEYEVDR